MYIIYLAHVRGSVGFTNFGATHSFPLCFFLHTLDGLKLLPLSTGTTSSNLSIMDAMLVLIMYKTTSYLSVYVVAKTTGNTDDHKTDSIALWTERLTTRQTTRQIKQFLNPVSHMHVLGNNAHQTLTGWFNNDSIFLKKFSWVFSRICLLERECQLCGTSHIQSRYIHTHTHTVAQTLLWV